MGRSTTASTIPSNSTIPSALHLPIQHHWPHIATMYQKTSIEDLVPQRFFVPQSRGGDGGGGQWLVRMEGCPGVWSVCLPLLDFPSTIKVQKFYSCIGSPGWSRKKGRKRVGCVCVLVPQNEQNCTNIGTTQTRQ